MAYSRLWLQLASICALLALWAAGAAAADKAAPAPRLADYLKSGELIQFVTQAGAFLQNSSDSEEAPGVAYDLLMAATVIKNKDLAQAMKALLALEYPRSFYARYMVTTLGEAKEYRALLLEQVKKRPDPFALSFAGKFCTAVRLGLEQWSGQLFDNELTLMTALLASKAGDMDALTACKQKLAAGEGKEQAVAAIVFGAGEDLDKLTRLHALADSAPARLGERFLIARLTTAERELPVVARILIEQQLEAGRFADALPAIEKLLAKERDPQVLFWCAWCQSTLGQRDQALAALTELTTKHAASPWAKPGAAWLACLQKSAANLDENAAALAKVFTVLHERGLGMIQGTIVCADKQTGDLKIYVALHPDAGMFAVQISRAGKLLIGYRTMPHSASVFVQGEPVHAYAQSGAYPAFQVNLQPTPDGHGRVSYEANLSSEPRPLSANGKLLGGDLTMLTTKAGTATMLRSALEAGWLPAAPQAGPTGRVYRWLCPKVSQPELDSCEICVSPRDEVSSFRAQKVACEDLRYGPSSSFQLTLPPWPEGPVVQHEKMDGVVIFRLMAAAMELFAAKPGATAAAAAKP